MSFLLDWLMTSELRVGRGRLILRVEYDRRQRELAEAKKQKTVAEYSKIRKDEVQARDLVSCWFRVFFAEIDLYFGLFSMVKL